MAAGAYISEIFASFQGEGPRAGQRHMFVRFAGCNMRCVYCDTEYSLTRVPVCQVEYPDGSSRTLPNPVDIRTLSTIVAEFCAADPAIAMISLTGGEPMVQREFIARWLEEFSPAVPCLLETNAVIPEGLDELLEHIEVVSADIKLPSNSGESPQWESHEEFLRVCTSRPAVETYVKVPVDAGTDADELARAVRLVRSHGPDIRIFLQPIDDRSGYISDGSDAYLDAFLRELPGSASDIGISPQLHKLAGVR